jgi:hypothetical protein
LLTTRYATCAPLAAFNKKLFHNPVLKGHGFSRADTEQQNRGLWPLRECFSASQAGYETGSS